METTLKLPKHVFQTVFTVYASVAMGGCTPEECMRIAGWTSVSLQTHFHWLIWYASSLDGSTTGILPHIKLLFQQMKYVFVNLPF